MITEKIIDNLIEILDASFINDSKIRLNIKSLLEKDLLTDNICNSFTNKGKRCKNKKKPDELYCGVHLKEKDKLKKYLIEKNIIKEKVIEKELAESEDDSHSVYNSEYEKELNETEDEKELNETEDEKELNETEDEKELNETEDDDILSAHDYEEETETIHEINKNFRKKINLNIKHGIETNYSDDELDFDE
jgi:hypothetical protein